MHLGCFTIIHLLPYSSHTIISLAPVDTQGLLNTVSIFYCEGHGDELDWIVNSETLNKQETGVEINTIKMNNSINI